MADIFKEKIEKYNSSTESDNFKLGEEIISLTKDYIN